MVKLATRLNKLRPVFDVRTGPACYVLPPPPAPQLIRLDLKYPRDKKRKPGVTTDGAFQFHKKYLPTLKYYNPRLAISVDTPTKAEMLLTLYFEGTDPEALRNIAKASKNPRAGLKRRELKQASATVKPVKESGNWRDAPARPGTEIKKEITPRDTSNDVKRPTADDDEVRIKAQPAVHAATASMVSPPPTIYERSVTLHINNWPQRNIWAWFKRRARGKPATLSSEDKAALAEMEAKLQPPQTSEESGFDVSMDTNELVQQIEVTTSTAAETLEAAIVEKIVTEEPQVLIESEEAVDESASPPSELPIRRLMLRPNNHRVQGRHPLDTGFAVDEPASPSSALSIRYVKKQKRPYYERLQDWPQLDTGVAVTSETSRPTSSDP